MLQEWTWKRPRKSLSSNLRYMSRRAWNFAGKGWFNNKILGERPKMWDLEVCFGEKTSSYLGEIRSQQFLSQKKTQQKTTARTCFPVSVSTTNPTPHLGHTMLPASEISLRQRIENRGPGRVQKGSAKNLEDFVFFFNKNSWLFGSFGVLLKENQTTKRWRSLNCNFRPKQKTHEKQHTWNLP